MNNKTIRNRVIFICTIAACGGLLFGLDMGYINGSLPLIQKDMNLTISQGESFAGILLVGSVIGALSSGFISRGIGRKKTIILSALFFSIFTLLGATTGSYNILYFTRFCLGLSVGCASFVVPLYLSEIAPSNLRGAFVAMFQLMVTIGIFVIFLSNSVIEHYFQSWRLMLAFISIPSIIMLVFALFIPETPRWFVLKKRHDEAKNVLSKIRETKEDVNFELNEIEESLKSEKKKVSVISLLSKPFFIKVLILGILIQFINTFCGINAIIYYSGQVFNLAGFDNPSVPTVIVGLINVFATVFAIRYVDKWGRKPILYFGLTFMVISLLLVGYVFNLQESGAALSSLAKYTILGSTLLYIIAYAVSFGAIGWTLCTEVFPLEGRDLGVTVTTAANYLFNTIIVTYSMTVMSKFGGFTLFLIFAICCALGFIILRFFIPETKAVSLEEIEMNLKSGKKLRHIGR